MVQGGNNLGFKLGLVFLSNLHSNHLQMTKCYPHSNEENYTYSNQLTNLEAIIFFFFRKLCNLSGGATIVHFPQGFTLTNTYETNFSSSIVVNVL
jgi:hypothetical protein